MKNLILTLVCATAFAAPFPAIRPGANGWFGSKTVLAGFNNPFSFRPLYAFTFTCVAATDVCTAGNGYTPVDGNLIQGMTSTTTLPAGLETVGQGQFPYYCVSNSSGTVNGTFKVVKYLATILTPACDTGNIVDITSTGTGTHTAYLYGYNSNARIYIDSTSGLPALATVTWYQIGSGYACNTAAPTSGGHVYSIGGGEAEGDGVLCPVVHFDSSTPNGTTGTWIINMSTDGSGTNPGSFSWDYVVDSTMQTFTPTPPVSHTTPASKTVWLSTLTAGVTGGDELGAKTYCLDQANPTEVVAGGTESGISYPLSGEFYLNRRKYIGVLPDNCGLHFMAYEKDYIIANSGGVPEYKQWAEPLFRGYAEGGGSDYYTAGALLGNSARVLYGARLWYGNERTNAYGLWSADAIKKYTGVANPFIGELRDALISYALRYSESDVTVLGGSQTFYLGLLAHALTYDYIYNGQDTRIPPVLIRLGTQMQALYNSSTHIQLWAFGASGSQWCLSAPTFYHNDPYFNCNINTGQKLNAYWSGPFAFLFAITGNTIWRDYADDWLLHNFDAGIFTGKEVSEAYINSFNAIGWLDGTLSYLQWYGDSTVTYSGSSLSGNLRLAGPRRRF